MSFMHYLLECPLEITSHVVSLFYFVSVSYQEKRQRRADTEKNVALHQLKKTEI